jgi:DNA polymerase/3'-5' exonuclease PolX
LRYKKIEIESLFFMKTTMDYKDTIIQALDVLRKRDIADKQPFKARAYQTVINQLKQRQEPVTSFDDVQAMKGLGDKIEKKIKEILETGQLRSAERAKELYPLEALEAFQNIYGVGPAKATELTKQGFRSIQDLRNEVKTNPKLLNDKQTVGLNYYEQLLQRIPRAEMEEHRHILFHYLRPFTAEIVGSFRRGLPTSGDIDVLIRVPKGTQNIKQHLSHMANEMKEAGYIEEVLAIGEHKCMAICRRDKTSVARRLDLLMTPEEEYAYSILYFTGSDRFNVAFRQHALEKGYTLNEHALTVVSPGPKAVPPMESEEDIFRFLGLRYVLPTERIDGKQIRRTGPKIAPRQ